MIALLEKKEKNFSAQVVLHQGSGKISDKDAYLDIPVFLLREGVESLENRSVAGAPAKIT